MTKIFYILGPEPIKRKPPLIFTPSQIKTTIRPNTFTAKDAGIYSNAELDQFWNRILFSKHSDSTLQLLGKALSYSFISSNTPDFDADSPHGTSNPYNTLRIGLHDKLLNSIPLFTPKRSKPFSQLLLLLLKLLSRSISLKSTVRLSS